MCGSSDALDRPRHLHLGTRRSSPFRKNFFVAPGSRRRSAMAVENEEQLPKDGGGRSTQSSPSTSPATSRGGWSDHGPASMDPDTLGCRPVRDAAQAGVSGPSDGTGPRHPCRSSSCRTHSAPSSVVKTAEGLLASPISKLTRKRALARSISPVGASTYVV